MKTMRVIGVAAIVLTAACVIAQQRYDMIVRQDFFAGFAGNKEALARGMKVTEETLAKDPNDRYASTRDLARDLQSVRDHFAEITSSDAGSMRRVAQSRTKLPLWIMIAFFC